MLCVILSGTEFVALVLRNLLGPVLVLLITCLLRYVRIDLITTRGTYVCMYNNVCVCACNLDYLHSDIWALGCVLYELATLKHAVSHSYSLSLYIYIYTHTYTYVYTNDMLILGYSILCSLKLAIWEILW